MSVVAKNKRGGFDIAVEEKLEAGIMLTGDEIKSIRADRVQLTGAYVRLVQGSRNLPKPVLIGMHLSLAKEPERTRTLLLTAKELQHLQEELSQKGKTAIPVDVHFRRGWAKLTIGIGKGRKRYDKRELLKSRDIERQIQRG